MTRALIAGLLFFLFCCVVIYAVANGEGGDTNLDGRVDMADVVSLVNYIFGGVPLPTKPETWRDRFMRSLDSAMSEFTDTNYSWIITTMPPRAVAIGIERVK